MAGEILNGPSAVGVPEPTARKNFFCVVSKATFGEYNVHDIQTNSAWSANPYGEDYAVVPDGMVESIMETGGFCDIELNKDGTKVTAFTPLERPVIQEPEAAPTQLDRVEAQVTYTAMMTGTMLEV